MIKQIAWNTFKNTGDINTYLELKQVNEAEQELLRAEKYENSKNKGNSNHRK